MTARKNSTKTATKRKPDKPRKNYPLTAHASGQWCKKIQGKQYYFGPWADPDAAEKKYHALAADLLAGTDHQPQQAAQTASTLTVKEMCNQYINQMQMMVDQKRRSPRTLGSIIVSCKKLVDHFGPLKRAAAVTQADFSALMHKHAKPRGTLSAATLNNEIIRWRGAFIFAVKSRWFEMPVDRAAFFGPHFVQMNRKEMRIFKQRARESGEQKVKFIERDEFHKLLAVAHTPAVRGQLWLGINVGFGNRDCGTLKVNAIDFDAGTISHARSKTGVERNNLPLWPETLAALREAIDARPEPKHAHHADHVFLTKRRLPWARENYSGPMQQEFAKLRARAGLDQDDRRKTFYCLRHTFETIGCQTGHQVAVNYIMGHVDDSMAGNYRAYQAADPMRLVTNFVRDWLFDLDTKTEPVPAVSCTTSNQVSRLAVSRRQSIFEPCGASR